DYGIAGTFAALDHNCVSGNNPDYDVTVPTGPGAISELPLYCDRSAYDYHLSAYSPCLGSGAAGENIGALDVGCPLPAECPCACYGDPICDGVFDVLDVTAAVEMVFLDRPPIADPNPACARLPLDTDCSGNLDILDVVRLIKVAFRGEHYLPLFCYPCEP
ncbi:MAG TPA: hypothetical protein VM118_06930, partial [Acidobacteriota bacterium]|nr:hypothetical protein [Acidobacteriota bacterium]